MLPPFCQPRSPGHPLLYSTSTFKQLGYYLYISWLFMKSGLPLVLSTTYIYVMAQFKTSPSSNQPASIETGLSICIPACPIDAATVLTGQFKTGQPAYNNWPARYAAGPMGQLCAAHFCKWAEPLPGQALSYPYELVTRIHF